MAAPADFSALPITPGETWFKGETPLTTGDSVNLEGKEYWIEDKDYATSPVKNRAYGPTGWRKVRVIRNSSGVPLLPGMWVQTSTAHFLRRAVGYSSVGSSKHQLLVDEFLHPTIGCPVNDLCLVTTQGFAGYVVSVTPAEAVITAGMDIFNVTAAASTSASTAGRAFGLAPAAATANMNALGVAVSGATTGNTGQMSLMYVYGRL